MVVSVVQTSTPSLGFVSNRTVTKIFAAGVHVDGGCLGYLVVWLLGLCDC